MSNKLAKNKSENKTEKKDIKKLNIGLWLIFFPPVGLFYLYKYKIIPRILTIFISILLTILLIVITYNILNPYAIIDTNTEKNLKQYESEIGQQISLERYDYNINNRYNIYDLVTNKGRYYVFVGNDNIIYNITQISENRKVIYEDFDFVYKGLFPEIISYYKGDIPIYEIINTDVDKQTLKIDNKELVFNIIFENVYTIKYQDEVIYINDDISIMLPKSLIEQIKQYIIIENSYCTNIEFLDNSVIYYITSDNMNYRITQEVTGRILIDKEIQTNEITQQE